MLWYSIENIMFVIWLCFFGYRLYDTLYMKGALMTKGYIKAYKFNSYVKPKINS